MKFRDITFAEGDYYNRQHFHDNKFLSKSSAMEERKLAILAPAIFYGEKREATLIQIMVEKKVIHIGHLN